MKKSIVPAQRPSKPVHVTTHSHVVDIMNLDGTMSMETCQEVVVQLHRDGRIIATVSLDEQGNLKVGLSTTEEMLYFPYSNPQKFMLWLHEPQT
jgi:hypothetical protein